MAKCASVCQVYSRVCGYFAPVRQWNLGKREEFAERKIYHVEKTNRRRQMVLRPLDIDDAGAAAAD
jgi:ribonucleoside-triphosphate reductase